MIQGNVFKFLFSLPKSFPLMVVVISSGMVKSNDDGLPSLLSIEDLVWAGHSSKYFTYINSFNSHYSYMECVPSLSHL